MTLADRTRGGIPVTCWAHRSLLEAAEECGRDLARFPNAEEGHWRARTILEALAGHCRTAAGVFDDDPTLADEPYETGRFRAVDLLAELVRQTRALLRNACGDTGLDRWPREDRWEEAEALFVRAVKFAKVIPQVVPRLDYATEAGSRAISHDRLAASSEHLTAAADSVRYAVGDALRLPHPDPMAVALAGLADQLAHSAQELEAHYERRTRALHTAAGLSGYTTEEKDGDTK